MKLTFEYLGQRYRADTETAQTIAIDLNFNGPQPNFFQADSAAAAPMQAGQFIGDTKTGGSCNVRELQLNPHCNGTHTETIGHVISDSVPIAKTLTDPLLLARLMTVSPQTNDETAETYCRPLTASDSLITQHVLQTELDRFACADASALIIRTLPNRNDKRSKAYRKNNFPFLTTEAMQLIVSKKFQHLLVDFPSVDSEYDEGQLANHRVFWNLPPGGKRLTPDCWPKKTITEMVYVPDEVADGLYLLNLQIPAFVNDAAPSRPLILKIET